MTLADALALGFRLTRSRAGAGHWTVEKDGLVLAAAPTQVRAMGALVLLSLAYELLSNSVTLDRPTRLNVC